MNKKSIILISSISLLLLCGCNKGKKDPYVYPDTDVEFNLDYSNNPAFKQELSEIYFENEGEVSETTLSKFLGVISLNDLYPNHVILKETSSKYYVDSEEKPVDGDFNYEKTTIITRNNNDHSLNGTVAIHDETWKNNDATPAVVVHSDITTGGTYKLTPNATTEIGKEVIDCTNDDYDEENNVGYSEKVWSKKMNLAQTSDFGELMLSTLSNIKKANETLAPSIQYQTSVKSYKDNDSLTIRVNSSSIQPVNTTGKKMIISYAMAITVANDYVTNTKYQYTIVEQDVDDTEYIVISDYVERQLSIER